MNKHNIIAIFCIVACLRVLSNAHAFEVPSYIKDPQDVSNNICLIINQNTPESTNAETVDAGNKIVADTLSEYAARLYADAISIRANMVGSSGSGSGGMVAGAVGEAASMLNNEAVQKVAGAATAIAGLLSSKDKAAVLQNEVKKPVKNIALYLKQIVELEAAIANLQGLQVLTSLSDTRCNQEEED